MFYLNDEFFPDLQFCYIGQSCGLSPHGRMEDPVRAFNRKWMRDSFPEFPIQNWNATQRPSNCDWNCSVDGIS